MVFTQGKKTNSDNSVYRNTWISEYSDLMLAFKNAFSILLAIEMVCIYQTLNHSYNEDQSQCCI